MTSEELRIIVPPDVEEGMKGDHIWPTRGGRSLFCNDVRMRWCWNNRPCHPDDAAAQIERRLVEWALGTHRHKIYRDVGSHKNPYGVLHHADDGTYCYHGPTLLHALVAAYRASKEKR